LNRENRKITIAKTDIFAVLGVIVILVAALVPVMTGWFDNVQEVAVRNEGWVYLNAARAAVEESAADCYTGIISSPVFAEAVRRARLRHIPPARGDFPHINDIFIDSGGSPSAVHIRNILRDGTETLQGLIVGATNRLDDGFWLNGGTGPVDFS
jgi:type II secretory pathway pseudopilin PulG